MFRVRSEHKMCDTQATSHTTHARVEHTKYVDDLPDLGSVLMFVYTSGRQSEFLLRSLSVVMNLNL